MGSYRRYFPNEEPVHNRKRKISHFGITPRPEVEPWRKKRSSIILSPAPRNEDGAGIDFEARIHPDELSKFYVEPTPGWFDDWWHAEYLLMEKGIHHYRTRPRRPRLTVAVLSSAAPLMERCEDERRDS